MTNKITFDDTHSTIGGLSYSSKTPGDRASGIHELQNFIPRFQNGTLTVFAPDEKVDETVLFYNLFHNITNAGTKALCISLDSSEVQVMKTCLSVQSHIPSTTLQNGVLNRSEFETLTQSCADLCQKDTVEILAPPEVNYLNFEDIIEDAVKNSGVQIVFFEATNLINFLSRISTNQTGLSYILRKLKRIAHGCMVPIIVTAPGSLFIQNSPTDQESPIRHVDTFIRLTVPEIDPHEEIPNEDWLWWQKGLVEKNNEGLLGSFTFRVDYREMRISE